jgi:hypothetical protein
MKPFTSRSELPIKTVRAHSLVPKGRESRFKMKISGGWNRTTASAVPMRFSDERVTGRRDVTNRDTDRK